MKKVKVVTIGLMTALLIPLNAVKAEDTLPVGNELNETMTRPMQRQDAGNTNNFQNQYRHRNRYGYGRRHGGNDGQWQDQRSRGGYGQWQDQGFSGGYGQGRGGNYSQRQGLGPRSGYNQGRSGDYRQQQGQGQRFSGGTIKGREGGYGSDRNYYPQNRQGEYYYDNRSMQRRAPANKGKSQ